MVRAGVGAICLRVLRLWFCVACGPWGRRFHKRLHTKWIPKSFSKKGFHRICPKRASTKDATRNGFPRVPPKRPSTKDSTLNGFPKVSAERASTKDSMQNGFPQHSAGNAAASLTGQFFSVEQHGGTFNFRDFHKRLHSTWIPNRFVDTGLAQQTPHSLSLYIYIHIHTHIHIYV